MVPATRWAFAIAVRRTALFLHFRLFTHLEIGQSGLLRIRSMACFFYSFTECAIESTVAVASVGWRSPSGFSLLQTVFSRRTIPTCTGPSQGVNLRNTGGIQSACPFRSQVCLQNRVHYTGQIPLESRRLTGFLSCRVIIVKRGDWKVTSAGARTSWSFRVGEARPCGSSS